MHWTDVVTSQPEGYEEDEDGNVYISSAEGLAWLSVLNRGLHGQQAHTFEGITINLVSDIDLKGYRWYPISGDKGFSGDFNGQKHTISNKILQKFPKFS